MSKLEKLNPSELKSLKRIMEKIIHGSDFDEQDVLDAEMIKKKLGGFEG